MQKVFAEDSVPAELSSVTMLFVYLSDDDVFVHSWRILGIHEKS